MLKRMWIACAMAATLCAFGSSTRAQDVAPELTLKDTAGAEQSLSSLRGKVVIVNFWATWCAPCRKEMPSLVKLQSELKDKGLQIIGVTVDTESFHDKVITYAKDNLNFPVWFGSTANMDPFGLGFALPSTVLIDRQGHVVDRIEGAVDEAAVRAKVEELLAKT